MKPKTAQHESCHPPTHVPPFVVFERHDQARTRNRPGIRLLSQQIRVAIISNMAQASNLPEISTAGWSAEADPTPPGLRLRPVHGRPHDRVELFLQSNVGSSNLQLFSGNAHMNKRLGERL
jgi:hypothetical protein